jgi:hypothetical protein
MEQISRDHSDQRDLPQWNAGLGVSPRSRDEASANMIHVPYHGHRLARTVAP